MKKCCILLPLLFLLITNSFGQKAKQPNFKINGTINADSGTVRLFFYREYIPNKEKVLEAQIKNNKFSISGYIPEPQSVSIRIDERYRSSDFIIEKGPQTISINIDSIDKTPDVNNKTMINEYPKFSAFCDPINIKNELYDHRCDSLLKLYNYNLPESIKSDLRKESDIIYEESHKFHLQYSKMNPNSNVAFWMLIRKMGWGYEPIFDSIYNCFSNELKNSYAGKVLSRKLKIGSVLSVGKQFPLLQCVNTNNEKFTLDIFSKNNLTLVDFWYSQCNPCRSQFNTLKDLYKQFSDKGFEIIGISVDRATNKELWENTIINDKLIWKQYWDKDTKEANRLSINAFPTNFLIDSTGKIIAKNITLGELEKLLNKSLK
ncbi:TlpA disulfide reductase family protein [Bacteroides sedimenti]|uniref:Thiol:disulfide interchange protein n=1 Tax=Bacteroides sedimenti TaxID=2136147 RepID=A0ABM8IBH7_9BACE